jgi:endonuclease/exonuclease/phosphatase family metal-dependent hydrolase
MNITVLTVNLHKGFGPLNRRFILPELRQAVREVSADIVFLQEVIGEHELHAEHVSGWPDSPHYEFLADTLWNDFAYGRNAVYPEGHHGNAVLSKFPITRYENHDVSIKGPERRGLLHCVMQLPGDRPDLHAVCVHLGLDEAQRQHQIDQLCGLIDGLPDDAPLLVAGDFNDWRLRGHKRLNGCAGLNEVFVQSGGKALKTFPARWPLLKLDRIYVKNAGHQPVWLPRRPWSHLSDHVPLAAEISL